jgi:hypothetical protein
LSDAEEDPLERQEERLNDLQAGLDDPNLPRFLLFHPEKETVVALGCEYPNGQVVLESTDEDHVQVWPDRETMLLHKPMRNEDVIWWDEPPRVEDD